METIKAMLNLQRDSVKPYKGGYKQQRLSYDLTRQTPSSIAEMNSVLKYFAARSNGEFRYWFTGDVTYSSDDPECQELIKEYEEMFKDERDKEDIRPLHSGQPETDSEGSASGVQEEGVEVPGVSLRDNA